MDPIQGLAVFLASLLGLVSTNADLQVKCAVRQTATSVEVQAEVERAVTSQVGDFILSGNPLSLVYTVHWGGVRLESSRTIRYSPWSREFQVRSGPGKFTVVKDPLQAFRIWRTLDFTPLMPAGELASHLGIPLEVRASLAFETGSDPPPGGDVMVLWGYKRVETTRLFRAGEIDR